MNAIEIFKQLIGDKIAPLIIKYSPYTDKFMTHPYRHTFDADFEKEFSDILFDSIIFYAYEKMKLKKNIKKDTYLICKKLHVLLTKIVYLKLKKKRMV